MLMRANDSVRRLRVAGGVAAGCLASALGLVGGVHHEQPGQRRAHPLVVDVRRGCLEDLVVRLDDGGEHVVERAGRLEPALEQLHREGAGDLAGLVSAHPVCDGEHRRVDEDAVLVLLPDATRIGDDAPLATRPGHAHCVPRPRRPHAGRSSAGASSLADGAPRHSRSYRSLGLQHGVAELHAIAGVQQAGALEAIAVVERSVRRAEILDHRLAVDARRCGHGVGRRTSRPRSSACSRDHARS